ncbi:MAG TPA: hypothetical protein VEK84_09190 [Terriglobales bacterium]|jgi:hypothetical protein|nr:hypothetical protein [Terriglobales bacterium]
MTLIELLYFVFVTLGASLAAQWVYRREGWVLAVIAFSVVLGLCIRFFFTGGFYRVIGFIFRRPDLKD